jgi:hypothetical protein
VARSRYEHRRTPYVLWQSMTDFFLPSGQVDKLRKVQRTSACTLLSMPSSPLATIVMSHVALPRRETGPRSPIVEGREHQLETATKKKTKKQNRKSICRRDSRPLRSFSTTTRATLKDRRFVALVSGRVAGLGLSLQRTDRLSEHSLFGRREGQLSGEVFVDGDAGMGAINQDKSCQTRQTRRTSRPFRMGRAACCPLVLGHHF